jgi:hypothetical protein
MQKLIPVALLAILLVGCKGGDSTAAGGTTTGSGTASGESVTLKLNPKEGEKYSYMLNAAGNEIGMSMTAEKVEADKITTVITFDSMKMNGTDAPAQVMDAMKKMKVTQVQDPTGKTLDVKMEGAPAGTPPMDTNSPSLPSGPVKVGDTWEGTSKLQGTEIKSKYKLAKIETQGGKQVAVIESTTEGLPGGMVQDGPAITTIEVATGMLMGMESKMKVKGPDGKEQTVSTSMKRI